MENFEPKLQEENTFISNTEIRSYLFETSKWGKFLAIVGFVVMGIMMLAVTYMIFGNLSSKLFPMRLLGIPYMIIFAVYYFPISYLYKFSVKIKQGLDSNDTLTITSGFQNLKSLFKFMAIFTIVFLSIYGLILAIVLPLVFFLKH